MRKAFTVMRRAQAAEAAQRCEQALARHAAAMQKLAQQSRSDMRVMLPVRRLDSLRRHRLLLDRESSAPGATTQLASAGWPRRYCSAQPN